MAQQFLGLNTNFGFFMFGFLTGIGAGGAAGCTAGFIVGKKVGQKSKVDNETKKIQEELRDIKAKIAQIEQRR